MLEEIKALIKLQHLDLKLEELNSAKESIPEKLNKIKKQHEILKESLNLISNDLETKEGEQRHLERELQVELERKDKLEGKSREIKTNKEYQSLLKEISMAKKKASEFEDGLLEIMESIEELREKLYKRKEELKKSEEFLKLKENEFSLMADELNVKIKDIIGSRDGIASTTMEYLVKRYELIKSRTSGLAVVKAVDGICQGCNMNIMPQAFNELIKGEDIITCQNCNRILYWEEEGEK